MAQSWKSALRNLVFVIMAVHVVSVQGNNNSDKEPLLGSFVRPAKSCIELREAGFVNGIYHLKLELESFQVYCDMIAAGGGWMMVATINQNTFDRSANCDNKWFTDSYTNITHLQDSFENWTNNNTFGTIAECTSLDYKNSAYFMYRGDDVMIRHVPNFTPFADSEEMSFLQYQSENGFMAIHGGNLQHIFSAYYPLQTKDYSFYDVDRVLDLIVDKSSEITDLIPNFYFYDYGNDVDQFRDGGNGMYEPAGVHIYLGFDQDCSPSDECFGRYVNYGEIYKCDVSNSAWSTRKSYPFIGLLGVGNFDHCFDYLDFSVRSDRPSNDSMVLYQENITNQNLVLAYYAKCRYGMTSPSLCDVIFTISNYEVWKSESDINVDYTDQTAYYYIHIRPVDRLSNMLLGYTLFSRDNGVLILESEIVAAMSKMLEITSEITDICQDCMYDDYLAVPVKFSVGNNAFVEAMLPPSVQPLCTGFLQFRAYGSSGSVYAMCPAVSVNDWRSEYVCIGGKKNPNYPFCDDCNDFTHWNGLPGTILDETSPVDFAHSLRDLNSTIMIFYR